VCILVPKYRVINFWPCKNDTFLRILSPYFSFVLNDIRSGVRTKSSKKIQREKLYELHIVASLLAVSFAFRSDEISTYNILAVCKQYCGFLLNSYFFNPIFVRKGKQDVTKDAAWETLQLGWIIKNKLRRKRICECHVFQ